MSELLFKRSEAVANLNQVEGFNPMELLRIIPDEGKGNQAYLDVKYRKLWFRLCHPNGKIVKKVMALKDNMAIVEARVYLDKNDSEDSYIASALAQKFYTDDPKFGNKFLELAETAATGRALADAGFGIQFVEGEENDPNQVDAGIPLAAAKEPMVPMDTAQHQSQIPFMQEQTGEQYSDSMQAYENMMPQAGMPFPQGSYPPQMFGQENQNPAFQAAPPAATMQTPPQKPQIDRTRSVEELMGQLTYEEAKQVVIGGKMAHANQTMGQVAIENPSALEWYVHSYKGKDNLIRAAAQIILNQAAA